MRTEEHLKLMQDMSERVRLALCQIPSSWDMESLPRGRDMDEFIKKASEANASLQEAWKVIKQTITDLGRNLEEKKKPGGAA